MRYWFGSPFNGDWRDPSDGGMPLWSQPVVWGPPIAMEPVPISDAREAHGLDGLFKMLASSGSSRMGWKMGAAEDSASAKAGAADFLHGVAGWKEALVDPGTDFAAFDATAAARLAERVSDALGRVGGHRAAGIELALLFPVEEELDFSGIFDVDQPQLLHDLGSGGEHLLPQPNLAAGGGEVLDAAGNDSLGSTEEFMLHGEPADYLFADTLHPLPDPISTAIEWGG